MTILRRFSEGTPVSSTSETDISPLCISCKGVSDTYATPGIGRYENIAKENRICQLCNKKGRQVIEDEYHFIVECETFTNLRNMYLKPECLNRNGFVQMLKCNDAEIVWNLAVYVFKAVALRKSLL